MNMKPQVPVNQSTGQMTSLSLCSLAQGFTVLNCGASSWEGEPDLIRAWPENELQPREEWGHPYLQREASTGISKESTKEAVQQLQHPGGRQVCGALQRDDLQRPIGVMQESGGNVDYEIKCRIGMTWETFIALRRSVLCSRKLKLRTRLRINLHKALLCFRNLLMITRKQLKRIDTWWLI